MVAWFLRLAFLKALEYGSFFLMLICARELAGDWYRYEGGVVTAFGLGIAWATFLVLWVRSIKWVAQA
jgi:hypothetical protein